MVNFFSVIRLLVQPLRGHHFPDRPPFFVRPGPNRDRPRRSGPDVGCVRGPGNESGGDCSKLPARRRHADSRGHVDRVQKSDDSVGRLETQAVLELPAQPDLGAGLPGALGDLVLEMRRRGDQGDLGQRLDDRGEHTAVDLGAVHDERGLSVDVDVQLLVEEVDPRLQRPVGPIPRVFCLKLSSLTTAPSV